MGIQLVMGFLDLFKGSLGKIEGRAVVEHNLSIFYFFFIFLEFYLCYSLLEALLRQALKPTVYWYILNNYLLVLILMFLCF